MSGGKLRVVSSAKKKKCKKREAFSASRDVDSKGKSTHTINDASHRKQARSKVQTSTWDHLFRLGQCLLVTRRCFLRAFASFSPSHHHIYVSRCPLLPSSGHISHREEQAKSRRYFQLSAPLLAFIYFLECVAFPARSIKLQFRVLNGTSERNEKISIKRPVYT